jgi:hypothetical protein
MKVFTNFTVENNEEKFSHFIIGSQELKYFFKTVQFDNPITKEWTEENGEQGAIRIVKPTGVRKNERVIIEGGVQSNAMRLSFRVYIYKAKRGEGVVGRIYQLKKQILENGQVIFSNREKIELSETTMKKLDYAIKKVYLQVV